MVLHGDSMDTILILNARLILRSQSACRLRAMRGALIKKATERSAPFFIVIWYVTTSLQLLTIVIST